MKINGQLTSIVVLNHNAGNLLLNCIESIFKTKTHDFEIILVDNVSTDDSHKQCKEKFPEIQLIENNENVGYCEGNNIGIRQAKGQFVVILNPDTKVEPSWLEELFDAYEKLGDGLYQPKLLTLDKPDVFNSAGNMLHLFGFGYSRGKGTVDRGQFDKLEQIGYASGACLFTSLETIKKIGLFDSFLFVYHDDLDLGWRASQLGIQSYYVPSSVVYHAGSYHYKWSPFKFYLLEKNRLYCLLTHYSGNTLYKALPSLLLTELLVLVFYATKGLLKEKIKGYVTIIKNRSFISAKYKELENKKLVSDRELIKNLPDDIFVTGEIAGNISIKFFNLIISRLSKMTKKLIIGKHDCDE